MMSTSMRRSDDRNPRPAEMRFEKSDQVVGDLNLIYAQLKALIDACFAISSTPTFQTIRRELLRK